MIAIIPNIAPNAKEPISPINTWAGYVLYQRNPIPEPMRAPQKTINSPESGRWGKYKYSAIKLFPIAYAIKPSAPPIKTDGKIANPSNPSVRFTAFEDPTKTNVPMKINKNGDIGIIKSLKKGTIKDVSGNISAE